MSYPLIHSPTAERIVCNVHSNTSIWKDRNIKTATKVKVMESMVWAVFQYRVEGKTAQFELPQKPMKLDKTK